MTTFILLTTILFSYFESTFLYGVAFFALAGNRVTGRIGRYISVAVLVAIGDMYVLPAIAISGATVRFSNPFLISLVGTSDEVSLFTMCFLTGWDLLFAIVEVIAIVEIGGRLHRRFFTPNRATLDNAGSC